MKTFFIVLAIYALFVAFNFWSLIRSEIEGNEGEPITNGGVVFCAALSLLGPLGIGASLAALGDGHLKEWADRPFRSKKRKDDQP